MKSIVKTICIFTLFLSTSFATIINVPADIDSIQGGINMAVDGDTVLVQPGTYIENINFNGKNIVVGSLTLTTGDTSYISQTVIDADSCNNYLVSVVTFVNGEDSTAILCGFTIKNGYFLGDGGGIKIVNSSPKIEKLKITSNTAFFGGGISLIQSNTKISQVTLTSNHNSAPIAGQLGLGAGIYCDSSNLRLSEVKIERNFSGTGGGIYCENSNLELVNCIVNNNVANNQGGDAGGGVFAINSNITLSNVSISGNSGEGITCMESQIYLSKVTIIRNTIMGMHFSGNSQAVFDPINRCNIYFNGNVLNYGNDLSIRDSLLNIAVVLDTFSVLNPTDYYARPIQNFTFDILNGKVEPVNSNLYVNPNGNNNNSGLTPSEPLKTIDYAIRKILADSLNPHTLYLADGLYSPSTNGEVFPLNMRDYVSLSGESKTGVILDAESQNPLEVMLLGPVVVILFDIGVTVENLTITGGKGSYGGAILCHASDAIILSDLIITGNIASVRGGGIYLGYSGADVTVKDVIICGNSSGWAGGGVYVDYCDPEFFNVTFFGNTAIDQGGAIYCDSKIKLVNSIIWGNAPENIAGNGDIYAFYSDIQGGWPGIGNINSDPMFVDTASGNYRLQTGSPCVDAGIQDTMIIFNNGQDTLIVPPIVYIGSAADMGAYEYDPTIVISKKSNLPMKYSLYQNYPNPFNPSTTIEFNLPKSEFVELKVYNILGKEVSTLVSKKLNQGKHTYSFDGKNLASGVYYYRIEAENFVQTRKMIYLK